MKNTIKKNKDGYGYRYTELAEINKYCLDNGITYTQDVETCEINGKDYIITYINDEKGTTKHRGCEIVKAVLSGIKNPVQEYGSSLTYCRRYSLLMALGLATEDDDAQSLSEPKEVTKEDAEQYKLGFGKHKGLTIKELPEEYIDWLIGNSKDEYLLKCIELTTGKRPLTEEEEKQATDLQIELIKLMSELEQKDKQWDRESLYDYYGTKTLSIEQMKEAITIVKKKIGE